jgi:hypothetical protein
VWIIIITLKRVFLHIPIPVSMATAAWMSPALHPLQVYNLEQGARKVVCSVNKPHFFPSRFKYCPQQIFRECRKQSVKIWYHLLFFHMLLNTVRTEYCFMLFHVADCVSDVLVTPSSSSHHHFNITFTIRPLTHTVCNYYIHPMTMNQ